jgi:acyl-CoA thioesterase
MDHTTMNPDALARACAQAMLDRDRATQHLAMELDPQQVSPGSAAIRMRITANMLNGHGTCHGGYLFTLADSAFAFACNTYNQRTVAQHCSVSFLAPAFEGDVMSATAREVSRTGRSGIYDVVIRNQDGAHIAEFRGYSRTIKGSLLPEAAH